MNRVTLLAGLIAASLCFAPALAVAATTTATDQTVTTTDKRAKKKGCHHRHGKKSCKGKKQCSTTNAPTGNTNNPTR